MSKNSVVAYNKDERVQSYDADMDLMHPNRYKMIDIALEVLPFPENSSLNAIDLGIGTGLFTKQFLKKYTNSKVYGIDGASSMIELAKHRLKDFKKQVNFITGDFQYLSELISPETNIDVVFSSYSLHHLEANEKLDVLKQINNSLESGGWFLNADLIVAETSEIEQRIQEIRINGIIERCRGKDNRFIDVSSTWLYLDQLETSDGDKPLTLKEDIDLLKRAGFKNISVFWQEYREVVYGGNK